MRPDEMTPTDQSVPGASTILVVDDQVLVREPVAEALQDAGYTVLEASSAPEAIKIAEQNPERIDLLISDVFLPTFSGPELVERLIPTQPRLKVIFVSGYPAETDGLVATLASKAVFVAKPFTLPQLLDRVREVLS
ncbi:response regulator [Planctomycetota bacterium]